EHTDRNKKIGVQGYATFKWLSDSGNLCSGPNGKRCRGDVENDLLPTKSPPQQGVLNANDTRVQCHKRRSNRGAEQQCAGESERLRYRDARPSTGEFDRQPSAAERKSGKGKPTNVK